MANVSRCRRNVSLGKIHDPGDWAGCGNDGYVNLAWAKAHMLIRDIARDTRGGSSLNDPFQFACKLVYNFFEEIDYTITSQSASDQLIAYIWDVETHRSANVR
jgi:hypothetical protein